jgi:hypothetical protein
MENVTLTSHAGVPNARSLDDPGAARDRHCAPDCQPFSGVTGSMKLSGRFPVVMGLPPEIGS